MCAMKCRHCPQHSYTKDFSYCTLSQTNNKNVKFHPTSTDFTGDVEKVDAVGINGDTLRSGHVKLNAA